MLIRAPDRAGPPPRQQSRHRGLPAALLSLAAVGFGAVLLYVHWANTVPAPEPDDRVLPRSNGYDACAAALARLRPVPRDSPLRRPQVEQAARLQEALLLDRAAVDALRRAIRLDYMAPAGDAGRPRTLPYARVQEAADRFAAEACVARADGSPARALDRALDAMELGSQLGRGGALAANQLGMDCIVAGGNQAKHCLAVSPAQARAAGERVERILGRLPSYGATVREERRVTLAALRLRLQQPPPAPGRSARIAPGWPALPDLRRLLYSRGRAYAALDRNLRAAVVMAEQPFWERRPVVPPDPEEVWLMPNPFRQRGLQWAGMQARLRLLRLELALQEYRGRYGRWPETLQELDGVPEAVLADPFVPGRFSYRRRSGGYLLYSRGPDGRDDGGRAIRTALVPTSRGDLAAGQQWPPRPAR